LLTASTASTVIKSKSTARPLKNERKSQAGAAGAMPGEHFSWLRERVANQVDLWRVSDRLNVNPSTVQKILEGNRVSRSVTKKIYAALEQDGTLDVKRTRRNTFSPNHSTVERLMEVYTLYEKEKSLRRVGQKLGLSWERVRQLLKKGAAIGLFKYEPPKAPQLSKEKILRDYRKFLKLAKVAKKNHVSVNYLSKQIALLGISDEELQAIRSEGRKLQSIKQYDALARRRGVHPTTTELNRSKGTRSLAFNIRRSWGSLEAFRKERNIVPGMPVRKTNLKEEARVLAGV
jgi:Mn-dependent DtxR family transcriptional regulator